MLAISAHASLGAQDTTVTRLPKPTKSCGGPLAVILVAVVDAKGTPVTDAKIEIKRQRDGKVLTGNPAGLSPSGEYMIMDDSALPLVPAEGARFVVRAQRGNETGSAVLQIGRSPNGCHVRRLGDTQKIVLRH
jgi:hypothetical protein